MGVGAPRRALRQGPEPYGVQQARNFRNARKRDGGSPSASLTASFSLALITSGIRVWANPVPAAAVIQVARVVSANNELKAPVAGSSSFPSNLST